MWPERKNHYLLVKSELKSERNKNERRVTGPHQNTGAPPPKAMLGHSAPKRRAKRLVAELRELREMATESKSGSLVFDWGVTSLDTIEGYELTPVIVFSYFLVCFSCETEYVRVCCRH